MSRRVVIVAVSVVGVFALLLGLAAQSVSSGSIATENGVTTVEIAMLNVPIVDADPLVEAPNQFLGVAHPVPEFDTSQFGPDMSLVQETSDLPDLDPDDVLRAVYLGHDSNGDPYYIWQSGSPDLRRLIGQIIADFGSVGRLETSYGSLVVGEALWENSQTSMILEMGLTTGSIQSDSTATSTFTTEWHALPDDIAAVVVYNGDEPVGWQRPVSGTVAFQFVSDLDPEGDPFGFGTEMVALTTDGEVWNRLSLFPG